MLYQLHLLLLLPLSVFAAIGEPCIGAGGRAGEFPAPLI